MDPCENLKEQAALAARIRWCLENEIESYEYEDEVLRLTELVLALIAWRSKGGFEPDWRGAQAVAERVARNPVPPEGPASAPGDVAARDHL